MNVSAYSRYNLPGNVNKTLKQILYMKSPAMPYVQHSYHALNFDCKKVSTTWVQRAMHHKKTRVFLHWQSQSAYICLNKSMTGCDYILVTAHPCVFAYRNRWTALYASVCVQGRTAYCHSFVQSAECKHLTAGQRSRPFFFYNVWISMRPYM